MVNEQLATGAEESDPREVAEAAPAPTPLVILASDDDAVCVDDLCLPADVRE